VCIHQPHRHTPPSHHWVCIGDDGENILGLPRGNCYSLDFHEENSILLQESGDGDLEMESDDLEETDLSILEMSDLGLESDILLQILSILVNSAILETLESSVGILLELLLFPLPFLLS